MAFHSIDFVRSILDSVISGSSRVVAKAMSRVLPDADCILSMSEIVPEYVMRGEEIWRRLPEDVVSEILRRLPTRDVARARCVCRGWNSVLSSPELRHLWYVRPCIDIEQWMGSGSCELPEMSWTAVTHGHCRGEQEVFAINLESGDEISIPLSDTVEVAWSHGLICRYWNVEGRMVVGNHRRSKWKLLPPFPGNRKPAKPTCIPWAYSARFIRHDLLHQSYILFFLEMCVSSRQAVTHLYDSRTASWQRINRHPMPRDRFRSGIRDGSVVVVGYHYVNSIEGFIMVEEGSRRVEEVGIIAYDFCHNSWDEISSTLQHSGSDIAAAVEKGEGDSICFRHRLKQMDGYRINGVFLCSNNAKDEYCRLLVVDGSAGVICLWQLDKESCTVFRLVSTVQLRPERPWEDIKNPFDRARLGRAAANASMGIKTWIIRSDATAFMAIVTYGRWSWLVIYNVGRLSWFTAHAYGDESSLYCWMSCRCKWALLEHDVQWHDHGHGEVQQQQHHVKVVQCRRPSAAAATAIRAAAADVLERQPRSRLHLVHAPDIWSSP